MTTTITKNAIMRIAKITIAVMAMWLMPKVGSSQTTFYYYDGKGAPDAVTSWGTNPDGTGTNPANFTTAGCNFYFTGNNGSTKVALPTTFSVTGAKAGTLPASKVVDSLGVNLIVPFGGLAAATTIGVSDLSWLTLQDTLNVKLGTLKPTSTVAYDGKATLNILAGTYGNLISTNDSLATRVIPKRTITIVGNFDPGMASFADTLSTITYKGTTPQHIVPMSYYSLTITNTSNAYIDSGDVVTISGGKLTVSAKDTMNIMNGGTLVYASKTAPTLTGIFNVSGTIQVLANLAAIPGSATTTYDTTANVIIGDGSNSVTALPKLATTFQPNNVTINAPALATVKAGSIVGTKKGAYTIGNDLIILAGNVNGSNGAGNTSLTIGGDLDIYGGSFTISDSTKTFDTLYTQGVLNLNNTGAFYLSNNSTDTILKGTGSLYASTDIIDSASVKSFGTADGTTVGGNVYFVATDTAGQVFQVPDLNNNTVGPITLHAAGGNEVEIFSDITLNTPLYCDTGSYTVDAGYHMTLNKGWGNYSGHSFVITDALVGSEGQGLLQVNNIPKNAWYTIPLGYDSIHAFSPMAVKSADDNISVTVTNYEMLSSDGSVTGNFVFDSTEILNVVQSTWNFTRNDAGTSPIFFKIGWYDSVANGGVNADTVSSDFTVYANINGAGYFSEYPTLSVDRKADSVVIELPGTFKTGYFMIGKKGIALLPLHFTSVQASLKNQIATISWQTTSEQNMKSYTVERSLDGANFNAVGAITAKNKSANSYTFTDATISEGVNYYRIKAVDNTGKINYSSIVKVTNVMSASKSINIYPNPVINKTLNVELSNQSAGIYSVKVISAGGQVLASKQINHLGGNSVNSIDLSAATAKGLCFVSITSKDGQTTKTVIIK